MAFNKRSKKNVQEQVPMPVQEESKGIALRLAMDVFMYVDTGNNQHQGARPYQEDAFAYSNIINSDIVSEKGMVAVLCDGMGGLSNGKGVAEYASQRTINLFQKLDPRQNIPIQIQKIAGIVNAEACKKFGAQSGKSSAGATMVFAYIYKNRIYWVTIGDSRLYLIRNGHIMQMNEDHDFKNQLLRKYFNEGGDLQAIESNRQKDSLVCFVGKKDIPYVDVSLTGYRILPGDMFILCTDGIYNAIGKQTMKQHAMENKAQAAADRIIADIQAANLPGQDNMTVMVIQCNKDH